MIVTAEQIERFSSLCQLGIGTKPRQGIGCLGEKILHVVLKQYLEPDPSFHEVKIGRYVADIARDSGVVEIQTRNFSALKKKLAAFLPHYPVTVVTPIPQIKWLSWIEEQTGEVTKKRKSPKTGTALDVFRELYHIREFLLHPHFQIQLIFLEVEEYRLLNGWGNGGKRGSTRYDRIPIRLLGERFLRDRRGLPASFAGWFAGDFYLQPFGPGCPSFSQFCQPGDECFLFGAGGGSGWKAGEPLLLPGAGRKSAVWSAIIRLCGWRKI